MSRFFRNQLCGILFALAMIVSSRSLACGPFFDNQILSEGDRAVLSAPVADFSVEISRLSASIHPPFKSVPFGEQDPFEQSLKVDTNQIRQSMHSSKELSEDGCEAVIDSYQQIRHDLKDGKYPDDLTPAALIPAGLPREFATYLWGAYYYHQDRMSDARITFRALLARPIARRKLRTVWAAYMIGKSYLHAHPDQAITWFRRTREYAAKFPDPLGLAASSYGWEAKAELTLRHFDRAIELYLLHDASGDPTAAMSLRETAERAIGQDASALKSLAANPETRQIITAFILSNGGPYHHDPEQARVAAWLDAVESANVTGAQGADRLAWAMYQAGRFDQARRWLARADLSTSIASWVNAKLLLRDGKPDEAMHSLARAARAFPTDEQWDIWPNEEQWVWDHSLYPVNRIAGELAALKLSRGQYTQSLDLLIHSGWWDDAAYVAERVLTVDELKDYVNRSMMMDLIEQQIRFGAIKAVNPFSCDSDTTNESSLLRRLLARRLTRLGKWKDARPYFDLETRGVLDEYIADLREGYDERGTKTDRARSLFAAACLVREHGMELMGTELGPDWGAWGGSFEFSEGSPREHSATDSTYMAMSADETNRVASTPERINRRFHYRYVAADHAWAASELMPDNSDQLAQMLCEAGSWLKARDPVSADRFYQALIHRCPGTVLGKQALKLHWFPPNNAFRA